MLLFAPAGKSRVGGADDGMRFKELRQLSLPRADAVASFKVTEDYSALNFD